MRIGLVAPPWVPIPPPAYGGTEEVVDLLARGLVAAGHEVLLGAASDSTCPVPLVPGTAASDSDALNESTSQMAHVVTSYDGMTDVDLVHDHTVLGPLYRGRPTGVPVAITNHGPFTGDTLTLFKAMSRDTAIVAISHDHASHAHGVPITRVIHHGLDLTRVPVGTGRGGYAAMLARMNPTKGVVEALRIARAAGVPLRIAARLAEPGEVAYFESEVKPLLTSEHTYIGEVAASEKYELIGDAFALLNPIQWSEPFGLAMIEALASGTPVIGTPRGAAPEIVRHGETGFLGEVDELAGYLTQAPDIDRARCRADVEERFSAERMVANHIALYADLIAGRDLSV